MRLSGTTVAAARLALAAWGALLFGEASAQNQPATQSPQVHRAPTAAPVQQTRRPPQNQTTKHVTPAPAPTANRFGSLQNLKDRFLSRFHHGDDSSSTTKQPLRPEEHLRPNNAHSTGNGKPSRLAQETPGARTGSAHAEEAPLFPRPANPPATRTAAPAGTLVRKGADGSSLYVHQAANGTRQILVERPDGTRVFSAGPGASYVQRPWNFQAQAFDRRTYFNSGKLTQQFYRQYTYNGQTLDAYATQRFYEPSVYRWAVESRTEPQPAAWNYVSDSSAWYMQYKSYFTPESSYTSPLAWLTDYLMANSLIAAWNAHMSGAQSTASAPPASAAKAPGSDATAAASQVSGNAGAQSSSEVSPVVKQKVADEVSRQIREESAEAQANAQNKDLPADKTGIVAELGQRDVHTFVVSSDLDLVDEQSRRCSLSEGDVVQVIGRPDSNTNTALSTVLASKGQGECERAADVAISLADLQDMQNHMRETIDQGLANRAAKSGVASTPAAFAAAAPAPDPDAAQQVEQQQRLAAAEG